MNEPTAIEKCEQLGIVKPLAKVIAESRLPEPTPKAAKPVRRVEMTKDAITQRLDGPRDKRTGVIVGESRDKRYWYVLRDGEKYRKGYHKKFWRMLKARSVKHQHRLKAV